MTNIITDAEKAIKNADNALQAKFPGINAPGPIPMELKKWFGGINNSQYRHIKVVVNAMAFGIRRSTLVFTYNGPGCTPTMFALAEAPPGGWAVQSPKRLSYSTFKISICPACLNTGDDHASKIGPMGTLLHELSHVFGNTNDVGTDHVAGTTPITDPHTGDPYYDIRYATELAKNHPRFSIHNAENYGLFIAKTFAQAKETISIASLFEE